MPWHRARPRQLHAVALPMQVGIVSSPKTSLLTSIDACSPATKASKSRQRTAFRPSWRSHLLLSNLQVHLPERQFYQRGNRKTQRLRWPGRWGVLACSRQRCLPHGMEVSAASSAACLMAMAGNLATWLSKGCVSKKLNSLAMGRVSFTLYASALRMELMATA